MLRTLGVLIAGTFWGLLLFGGLFWVIVVRYSMHSVYSLYLIELVTGIAVGLFVGFSRINKAGLVAAVCLLPPLLLEYGHRFSPPPTGLRLLLLLLGTGLKISIAFAIAHNLAQAAKNSPGATE
ncbi:MAG TPA: hypothetical protein VLY23_00930 [Candidatus Acidoferrum sp.]|nr:hypothetical protein [Candidatus Acidoferrum sp.]